MKRLVARRYAGLLLLLLLPLAACSFPPNSDAEQTPPPTITGAAVVSGPLDETRAAEQASISEATPTVGAFPGPSNETGATPSGFSSAAAEIGEVVWATSVDAATKAPTEPVSMAPADTQVIFATLHVERIQAGTVVAADWLYNSTPIDGLSSEVAADSDAQDLWIEFHIERAGTEPWPVGEFAISITVNGQPASEATINVEPDT